MFPTDGHEHPARLGAVIARRRSSRPRIRRRSCAFASVGPPTLHDAGSGPRSERRRVRVARSAQAATLNKASHVPPSSLSEELRREPPEGPLRREEPPALPRSGSRAPGTSGGGSATGRARAPWRSGRRDVADVRREAVVRKDRVHPAHDAVAGDLGDDRGGGDRGALLVPVDHSLMLGRGRPEPEAVDEAGFGRR